MKNIKIVDKQFCGQFILARNKHNKIIKGKSKWIFNNDNITIEANAKDAWGGNIKKRWKWFSSKDYGKEVIRCMKAEGVAKINYELTGKIEIKYKIYDWMTGYKK